MSRVLVGLMFLVFFLVSLETSYRMLKRKEAGDVATAEMPLLAGTVACSLILGLILVVLVVDWIL